MRNLGSFGKMYKTKQPIYVSSKLPRKRRAPPRIEECLVGNAAPDCDEDIVSYHMKIYYEALDFITIAITVALTNKILKISSNWKSY